MNEKGEEYNNNNKDELIDKVKNKYTDENRCLNTKKKPFIIALEKINNYKNKKVEDFENLEKKKIKYQ